MSGIGQTIRNRPSRKDVIFRDLGPEDRAWMPVGAAWKPDSLTAPAASKFIDVLAQICGGGNGGVGSISQGFRQVGRGNHRDSRVDPSSRREK
jgi:hypothetical protein